MVASRVDGVNKAILVEVLRESLEGEEAEAPRGGHGIADGRGEGAGDAAGVDVGVEDGVGAIAETSVDEGGISLPLAPVAASDGGSSSVGLTMVASRVDGVNEAVLVEVLRESLKGEEAEALGGGHGVANGGGEGAGDSAGVDVGVEGGVGAVVNW